MNTDEKHLDKTTASNSASNSNPYANANAPPAPAEPAGGYRHQVNSATNLGYPPYPSSDTGSKSGYPSYPGGNTGSNNGYPPYPSPNQGNRQQDLGYPPYPTHNKMPMPGQSNYPSYPGQPGHSNYPVYPGQQPGYPGYPQQLPGHQNYPYPNYPNQNRMYHNNVYSGYRRNSAIMHSPCSVIVYLAGLVIALANRSWSSKWMDDTVVIVDSGDRRIFSIVWWFVDNLKIFGAWKIINCIINVYFWGFSLFFFLIISLIKHVKGE